MASTTLDPQVLATQILNQNQSSEPGNAGAQNLRRAHERQKTDEAHKDQISTLSPSLLNEILGKIPAHSLAAASTGATAGTALALPTAPNVAVTGQQFGQVHDLIHQDVGKTLQLGSQAASSISSASPATSGIIGSNQYLTLVFMLLRNRSGSSDLSEKGHLNELSEKLRMTEGKIQIANAKHAADEIQKSLHLQKILNILKPILAVIGVLAALVAPFVGPILSTLLSVAVPVVTGAIQQSVQLATNLKSISSEKFQNLSKQAEWLVKQAQSSFTGNMSSIQSTMKFHQSGVEMSEKLLTNGQETGMQIARNLSSGH